MHITSLEAHTTLIIYNIWKLALRGHLNTDARTRDRTRNFLITRTMPLTARPQLHTPVLMLSKEANESLYLSRIK